ncbi:MAG: hypothetical protein WAO83_13060 [Fuerstiella sp.]
MISLADKLLTEIQALNKTPAEAWESVLSQKRFSSAVLSAAVLKLHNQKDYDNASEAIKAAIRHDQAQVWMYDVLALELKLANRPQKEIDRVLLSRIDFAAGDESQLLLTAAYMSRFEAYEQAINICKEAVKLNPTLPDTWAMARRTADRWQDVDAIIWSRIGTMNNVWGDNYEALHQEAETELRDLEATLTAAGNTAAASKVKEALIQGKIRDLRIRVVWSGDADLDLSVTTPHGNVCSYKSRRTVDGGMLIRESDGGKTSAKAGRHTEEFVCVEAASGEYKVKVRNIAGRVITGKAIVEVVRHENSDRQQSQSASINVGARNAELTVSLTNGRAAN